MTSRKGASIHEGRQILARNVKVERALRDLSQDDLADLCCISRNLVSLIERCETAATVDTVERLAKGLDVGLDHLFISKR